MVEGDRGLRITKVFIIDKKGKNKRLSPNPIIQNIFEYLS